MRCFRIWGSSVAAVAILVGMQARAWAIALPDSSSCSTDPGGTPCLTITNTFAFGSGIKGVNNGAGTGVVGQGQVGVQGTSITNGVGVYGYVNNANGGTGVQGTSTYGAGVGGQSTWSYGVSGSSTNSAGVYGTGPIGVSGEAGFEGYGVKGNSTYGGGVFGSTTSGTGVYGSATSGTAVYGTSSTGWSGYFNGKLYAATGWKPGGGSWTDSSDARLKKDIKPIEGALARLMRLKGVTYEWIDPKSHGDLVGRQTGMIAQDVEKVFPEWIGTDPKGFKTLTFRGFEALSVEATRTLAKENEGLRSQVSHLEDRIARLEQRPIISSMFSGGLNVTVALGAIGALVFSVIRRRREPRQNA